MNFERTKTLDGERLAWWGSTADEAYWQDRFADNIVQSHKSAGEEHSSGFLPILRRHLPRAGRILEAGCGTGWVVSYLRRHSYEIEGVDYSANLVCQVLEQFPDLPIRVGNVCNLDVPDEYYQGYVSLGVIEHRREGPEPFLNEAYRIVASGGTLCISVPYFNLLRRLKSKLGLYSENMDGLPFYQYGFSKEYFQHVLESQGFIIKRFEFYGTKRCLQEELANMYGFFINRRGLWRLSRYFDRLDPTGIAPHMIMAIVSKP